MENAPVASVLAIVSYVTVQNKQNNAQNSDVIYLDIEILQPKLHRSCPYTHIR